MIYLFTPNTVSGEMDTGKKIMYCNNSSDSDTYQKRYIWNLSKWEEIM